MVMNDVLGALNEAIRCREEKDEDLLSESDNSPSKKSAQGHSPSKLAGKGIRWAPNYYVSCPSVWYRTSHVLTLQN
jgi:hypothetical protein